ncbi:alpha-1,6-mannosyl-glycoprotein 2-beta-N-acetylglucosaminyltransferase-like isoform X2 [Oratosquilla oratoria]|uniref:alpha-1,6-mannosyl-glycoprotein 2-beta-N-acetylglucosaminyltransferase-like isoform X2 n=1 Tax=Oratosquilla oratoria TaxID=337810 RepID=UPI003F75FA35
MRGSGWGRFVRVVGVVVVLSVAWLQLSLAPLSHEPTAGVGAQESLEPDPSLLQRVNPIAKFLSLNNGKNQNTTQASSLNNEQIEEIKEQIQLRSGNETILNEELFGPVQQETVVIVVQVHDRLEYLRHLIVSLAQARDIDTVLLIFSHDVFDDEINKLVTTIDFCKTHPREFPGEGPNDCTRNMNKEKAAYQGCIGDPDLYGHYREARFTQTKHHWWWKANKVFDDLWPLKNHTGLVLFLEEDHYVAEDFLHMLKLVYRTMPYACPKCHLITLGTYVKNLNYNADSRKVEITQWISSKHNMGFVFNHTVWKRLKACGTEFCNHDDYNWDWSLQYVSMACLKDKLFTMMLRGPRVFHIGDCGVHHKKKDCSSKIILNKVHRALHSAQRLLFPRQILVAHGTPKKVKKPKGNGGWGDQRDQALCRSFTFISGPSSPFATSQMQPLESSNSLSITVKKRV